MSAADGCVDLADVAAVVLRLLPGCSLRAVRTERADGAVLWQMSVTPACRCRAFGIAWVVQVVHSYGAFDVAVHLEKLLKQLLGHQREHMLKGIFGADVLDAAAHVTEVKTPFPALPGSLAAAGAGKAFTKTMQEILAGNAAAPAGAAAGEPDPVTEFQAACRWAAARAARPARSASRRRELLLELRRSPVAVIGNVTRWALRFMVRQLEQQL